jgi:hypothetical protein
MTAQGQMSHGGVEKSWEGGEPNKSGLDIRVASALSLQHDQSQPSTDKHGAEEVLARQKGTGKDAVHLAGGDREPSDSVNRVASRARVRKSRALILSAIRRHLADHAAYFPIRWLLDW